MIPIVVYGLKRKLLKPVTVVNLILLPLLLIVILGNALASTFDSASSPTAVEVDLALVDTDQSEASARLTGFVEGAGSVFSVHGYDSLGKAKRALGSGGVTVVLSIAPGYGDAVAAGDPGDVDLYAIDDNVDQLRAAQIALDAYGDVARASSVLMNATGEITAEYRSGEFIAESGSPDAVNDPSAGVSGITYYAVTMLVLILIYGVSNTMNFVTEEYAGPLGDRYLATPTNKIGLALSQVICGTILTLIQAVVIVLVAKYAFRADYGTSVGQFALIVFIAALFFNCIGLFLGMLARRRPILDTIATIAIPAMTFLGGGFVKVDLPGLQELSINSLFQNSLFQQISGTALDWQPLITCAAVGAAAIIASVLMLRRPEGR